MSVAQRAGTIGLTLCCLVGCGGVSEIPPATTTPTVDQTLQKKRMEEQMEKMKKHNPNFRPPS